MDGNCKHPVDQKKVRFKNNTIAGSKKNNVIWTLTVTVVSFLIATILTIASSNILKEADIIMAFLVIFIIILINIFFDIIGTAVTAADEKPFHAMASRKLYAAKQSIKLIRNADKVSNVCNDIVGDICGIISGAAGTYIIFRIIGSKQAVKFTELVLTGLITAVTVGGKALGKTIALRGSNNITYRVSVVIKFVLDRFTLIKRKGKTKK